MTIQEMRQSADRLERIKIQPQDREARNQAVIALHEAAGKLAALGTPTSTPGLMP
jgi:hypothetical protein